jgi:hypothetical protein
MPHPLASTRRRRKLTLDADVVRRYRLLAAHEGLSVGDALDLALREALERRGIPEELEASTGEAL